jgi:HK97 family phage portal protein
LEFFNFFRKKREKQEALTQSVNNLSKSYNQLAEMIAREKSATIRDPKTNPRTQLREYKSWVSSCVSLAADTVSTNNFKFYKKDTDIEIVGALHSFKNFAKPFNKPNEFMTFKFIKKWCQTQLDLCGMSVIYKAKNMLGQTWELWPLNMNDFNGAYDSQGAPIELDSSIMPRDIFYVFLIGGKQYVFSINEIILLMYPHPLYKWIGASPIQQQAYAVDIQTYVEIYERDFFANSARIDMILSSDIDITQTKADEIKSRWKEKYQKNYHDIAVLGSGLKPVPMKYTNTDFEFLHLSQWSKDMVLGAYRTPESKLGKSGSENRQNAVISDIYYAKECIQPRLTIWDEECTKEVISQFDDRIELRHENPIPRDRQIETQEARIYLSGAPCLTINEARKYRNLDKIEGGDRIVIPNNFIFLDRLDEMMDSIVQAKQNNFNDTDPNRHQDDNPHTNPDGTDDRDNLPSPGRSFNYNEFEGKIIEIWYKRFEDFLNILDKNKINDFIKLLCVSTIKSCFIALNIHEIETTDWVDTFSNSIGKEIYNTFSSSNKDLKIQLYSNSRISKLIYYCVRTTLNYSKFLISVKFNLLKEWEINRNFCGHKARIKSFESFNDFLIGDTNFDFPGSKGLNLDCDCILNIDLSKLAN